jgi:uncharacterized protein (DUF2147 family)
MKSVVLVPLVLAALTTTAIAPATSSMSSLTKQVNQVSEPLGVNFPPDSIVGPWWTENQEKRPSAKVEFRRAQDGTYVGILAWAPTPAKDVNNKDPKLRDRSTVGIVLMWNLRYEDGEYVGGYVYNPEDGGTYRVKAEVQSPDVIKVRGYFGISLFGQTQTWTRAR